MKIKLIGLTCLIGMVVLSIPASYEYSWAKAKVDKAEQASEGRLKVGVVSIWRIFQDCKKNVAYREEAIAERDGVEAELKKLSKEIEAEEAGLKVLKEGSSDHLALMKGILEKRAKFQAQREFYAQQVALKDQQWTGQLYKDILKITGEIAAEKGLDMVLENSEPELPASSANELMLTIRTHKLLYSHNCLDITDEVIAQLDAEK